MDLTAPLIFLSIFVLASISLFLVYKYGIKKKSYEEALAEHRKQTSALLGTKPKPKEKKNKKAAKKINKEKAHAAEGESPDDVESVDSRDTQENVENPKQQLQVKAKVKLSNKQHKIHVDFKGEPEEVPAVLPAEKEVKEISNKRRVKKVRPILLKKASEQEINLLKVETPSVNHFEQIHPKDELELFHANSKDDIHKPEVLKEEKKFSKKNKQYKQNQQQVDVVELCTVEQEKMKEEKAVENIVAPLMQDSVINTGKEKKKKKSEYNSRQQITAERDQLIQAVRNVELSRTEVQSLIDLLLNKQLEAPAIIDDWSEGKSDPVQKLKKQLTEKEKQLADEQDALVGVQAKLKEVRNEQLAERAQFQQKLRSAEESRIEIVTSYNRLQQKVQELEDYRNKELANFQHMAEENKALQIQNSQLEATLMNYRETDALINNVKTENSHLTNELQLLTQEVTNYQSCVLQIQNLQDELRGANEYIKGLERNHNFALATQQEENRNLAERLQRSSEAYLKEEQKLKDIIEQLKAEKQELQEKNSLHINGSSEQSKEHEIKVLNLTNRLSSVNESLLDAERRYQSDLTSSQEKYNQLKIELEEQKNTNNELRKKNWKVMEALNAAENRNKQASIKNAEVSTDRLEDVVKTREENAQKEFIQRLFPEVEHLKSVSVNNWQSEYEHAIRQYITKLQNTVQPNSAQISADVTKLQNEVQHYKTVLDDMEGILKNLQSNTAQEELKWRNTLNQKEADLAELESQYSQLQLKVSSLEIELDEERSEKTRLLEERHQSTERPEVKTLYSDATATIKKLSEEVDLLKEQLRIEQTKNSNANFYQNGEAS